MSSDITVDSISELTQINQNSFHSKTVDVWISYCKNKKYIYDSIEIQLKRFPGSYYNKISPVFFLSHFWQVASFLEGRTEKEIKLPFEGAPNFLFNRSNYEYDRTF